MNKEGFTLMDLIVSMGIMIVITAVAMANFRAGQRNDSVRQSSSITASLLRKAQTMSLSGAKLLDGTYPQGGYGIRLGNEDTNKIILFADKNGNYIYDSGEMVDSKKFTRGVFFTLEESLDVVFPPLLSSVYFNGEDSPFYVSIGFSAENATISRNVLIYRLSGQIRVE